MKNQKIAINSINVSCYGTQTTGLISLKLSMVDI